MKEITTNINKEKGMRQIQNNLVSIQNKFLSILF